MRSRARLAAAAGVVSLALAGCEGSTDPERQLGESPEAAAGGTPEVGTCWAVPAASAFDAQYWFDDSARVPCTEPHTTQTALAVPLAEPTIAAAKERVGERAGGCWDVVRRYVGIDEEDWIPWGYAAYLPSKEEIANGASWVRCDAVFPETLAYHGARTITVPAAGLARDAPGDFWACLDQPPTQTEQPFVPCDQPHSYEQTGKLAILHGLDQYPSATELAAEARRQCRPGVPAGYEDVSVTAGWDPRSVLKDGSSIAGSCFMFNADGQPLPAR